jgi:hypothetical protein
VRGNFGVIDRKALEEADVVVPLNSLRFLTAQLSFVKEKKLLFPTLG